MKSVTALFLISLIFLCYKADAATPGCRIGNTVYTSTFKISGTTYYNRGGSNSNATGWCANGPTIPCTVADNWIFVAWNPQTGEFADYGPEYCPIDGLTGYLFILIAGVGALYIRNRSILSSSCIKAGAAGGGVL